MLRSDWLWTSFCCIILIAHSYWRVQANVSSTSPWASDPVLYKTGTSGGSCQQAREFLEAEFLYGYYFNFLFGFPHFPQWYIVTYIWKTTKFFPFLSWFWSYCFITSTKLNRSIVLSGHYFYQDIKELL